MLRVFHIVIPLFPTSCLIFVLLHVVFSTYETFASTAWHPSKSSDPAALEPNSEFDIKHG
jgi:hypothetical protein